MTLDLGRASFQTCPRLRGEEGMFVVKRNGQQEPVSFNAIYERVAGFCEGLDPIVDPVVITQKVVSGVYPGVTTQQLDELAAGT